MNDSNILEQSEQKILWVIISFTRYSVDFFRAHIAYRYNIYVSHWGVFTIMGMPEMSSCVVSDKVVSECVTLTYRTLGYHGHSVHVLGFCLKYPMPVDGSSPPNHVVGDIHNNPVSKAHLRDTKMFAIRRTKSFSGWRAEVWFPSESWIFPGPKKLWGHTQPPISK